MSSPLPPDPYVALGVSSTADLATIRSAHRKLVLKFHPDRIRDEAEREKGKLEFQKVQQAYEILADEGSRERYDNKVKLADLQRERFAKEATRPPPPTATYSSRPSPPLSSVRKELRSDGRNYEERAPPADYFDTRDHYDDPLPRSTSKKYDLYDKKASPAPKSSEKKEKTSSGWTRGLAPAGVPIRVAMNLKARASEARERTKEHAQTRETKDRERRKERSEKTFVRRAVVVDEEDYSSSESETVVPAYRPSSKASKPPPSRIRATTESDSRSRASPPRRRYEDEYSSRDEHEKWERHHQSSRDYIAQSQKRPGLGRSNSDADHFWEGDSRGGRRSGDDSDKRPSSSRRTATDDRRPYPSMPSHTSAPQNLRPHVIEREPVKEPQRSKTAAYPSEREHRRAPDLSRSQTMPVQRGIHRDGNAPSKSSNLKHHAETQQDSGYSSNSTPHTPEMRGDSPIRENPRQPTRRQTSTKYAIVEPESEEDTVRRGPRLAKMVDSDDERPRRYNRSPDPAERRAERRTAERPDRPTLPKLNTDTRPRSARVQEVRASVPRGDFAQYDSASPRHSPTVDHRKGMFFGEIQREPERERESAYSYRPEPGMVRSSSYRSPSYANYRTPRDVDDDYAPSAFRPSMHSGSRRGSATAAH